MTNESSSPEATIAGAATPPRGDPDEEPPSTSDDLRAAADLVRLVTLDPHTATDLVLDAVAHNCVPNDAFCYLCAVQAEQEAGRHV